MTTAKAYENRIAGLLERFMKLSRNPSQIRVRKSLKYHSEEGYRSYSPLIDISVGPFSETPGMSLWKEFDQSVISSRYLIDDLLTCFRMNYVDFGSGLFTISDREMPVSYRDFVCTSESQASEKANWNARCFIAIEVENSGSKKHMLGDIMNVSVSGRIGIVIKYDDTRLKGFLRQLEYIAYTIRAKKISFNSRNIIVLQPEQLERALLSNIDRPNESAR